MESDKTTAVVFDIKRFAVHDGPGIRTSVFFKGCPLDCKWCHNPEGLDPQPQLWYFQSHCLHCGDCITACPEGALSFSGENLIVIDRQKCTTCGKCTEVCPSKALAVTGNVMDMDALEEELLRDQLFYRESGGGITLTGGEPLARSEAALDILKRMKARRIHTAVETSLHVHSEVLRQVMDFTDLFLTDLKLIDRNRHKEHTGRDNQLILQNIKMLMASGKDMIVRVPLIPGYTDDSENLTGIADFISEAENSVTVELMNFNPLARDKFRVLGRPYAPEGVSSPYSEEQMEKLRQIFREKGLTVI